MSDASEIVWLNPNKSKVTVPNEVDVHVKKVMRNGKVVSEFRFYNGSELKISHTGFLMIGLNHERIFLKECAVGCGRKICNNSGKGGKTKLVVVPKDFDTVFPKDEMYGMFKLQRSAVHDAWFIDFSGRLEDGN